MDCILSGHGRTLEYVNVEMILENYSARVIREWYTHIGNLPTRLQSSTRYINYADKGFYYITPHSINDSIAAKKIWDDLMIHINKQLNLLDKEYNIPKEDIANGLPLGMCTKIVDKRNLRNLIDMSHVRKCKRAYWEYRELFNDIETQLSQISNEWKWVVSNLFVPKCEFLGKCTEKNSCIKQSVK